MKIVDYIQRHTGMAYHYTNAEALRGIIKESKLYATNIGFLNDSNEYWHAVNMAIDHIDRLNSKCKRKLYEEILSINNVMRDYDEDVIPFYIASFTESSDSASFLERYGNFNLGLKFGGDTKRQPLSSEVYFTTGKVIYKDDEKFKIFDQIIQDVDMMPIADLVREYGHPMLAPVMNNEIKYRALSYILSIQFLACWFKASSYQDEREVRFVAHPEMKPDALKYRIAQNAIIPYMEIEFNQEGWMWDSILVGSRKYFGSQKAALINWLNSIKKDNDNYRLPEIKYSTAGHRLKIG